MPAMDKLYGEDFGRCGVFERELKYRKFVTGRRMAEMSDRGTLSRKKKLGVSVVRVVLLALLVTALTVFIVIDLDKYISLNALKMHREILKVWVVNHGILTVVIFVLVYALVVAISIPGAVFISIAGGFMFGPYLGTLYVVIGATIGAVIVFLVARHALREMLRAKAYPTMKLMELGFQENEMSYLLILRLVPIFPFWLVNLVPALLGVGLRTYTVGTFFGIIPGAFVYTMVGNGAGTLLDADEDFKIDIVFEPNFFAPLVGLVFLACIPIVYKKLRGRKGRLYSLIVALINKVSKE
ncbi:MAG: hypothetical protein CFH41_02647 [Alphaproteobacteria bacterium MarineAlpha11_Bin1]|mgnify:CR=1 FL=1|nr:MAG: hypothetical protein CFH41_02647 [Alphaproteobacteria bacterium MarineAlpha11_Bin1]|tara:strand:+ start:926 stop:1816 length:891 start_codon:yes stop_codon:yes gene_type:complete